VKRLTFLKSLAALAVATPLLAASAPAVAADRIVMIVGHATVRKLDMATVRRIYTGKTVELDGLRVVPVNAAPGSALRQRFLAEYLDTSEDDYLAYWTVRRYVGKGTPPTELRQPADIIDFVNRTPGAIGYVDEADVPRGMNVVLRP
jgi:ABC-type phosphate transport system substrate-binding protein